MENIILGRTLFLSKSPLLWATFDSKSPSYIFGLSRNVLCLLWPPGERQRRRLSGVSSGVLRDSSRPFATTLPCQRISAWRETCSFLNLHSCKHSSSIPCHLLLRLNLNLTFQGHWSCISCGCWRPVNFLKALLYG